MLHQEVLTPQGSELHLNTSTLKRPVPLLEVFVTSRRVSAQGPELHLDLVGQQELVLLWDVSTLQELELHRDIFRPQLPVLHLVC
jgi:hypothetical protein